MPIAMAARWSAAERVATYGVPVASVVLAALVVLGPGAHRGSLGVRVAGRTVQGSTVLVVRLLAVRRVYGIDDIARASGVRLEVSEAGELLGSWEGEIGDDGVGEAFVRLAHPAARALDVRVTAHGVEEAAGRLIPAPREPPRRRTKTASGIASGDVALEVIVDRGVMTAPFPEALSIRASETAQEVTVRAAAPGLDLGSVFATGSAPIPPAEPLRFVARPLAHEVELTLEASTVLGRKGHWEGHLPVIPGALWLDPSSPPGRLVVATPAPRDHAFVSVFGDDGDRLFGASIPLAREAGARGEVPLPKLPRAPDHVLLAGDPLERGPGTVAWPLGAEGQGAVVPRPIEVLLDGVPAGEAREAVRASRARRAGLLLLGAAGLLEVLLLARQSRRSARRLDEHLRRAGSASADGEAVDLSRTVERGLGLELGVYAALIALGFAMVGALASFR